MASLKRFSGSDLILDAEQAKAVLTFFFGEHEMPTAMTDEDRSFAQGLLVEAIDASYSMGYVEAIWDAITDKNILKGNLKGIVKSFVKLAAKNWFKRYKVNISKLNDIEIYQSVKVTLARNFRTPWQYRLETGEYIY